MDNMDEIQDTFNMLCNEEQVDFSLKIGCNLFVTMSSGVKCVDIRKFYVDKKSSWQPGQPGIGLKIPEFEELMAITDEVTERLTQNSPHTPDTAELSAGYKNPPLQLSSTLQQRRLSR